MNWQGIIKRGSDELRWYYWVAIYTIIIGGILWTVIPYKSVWFNLALIAVITAAVLFVKYFPTKLEKKEAD